MSTNGSERGEADVGNYAWARSNEILSERSELGSENEFF